MHLSGIIIIIIVIYLWIIIAGRSLRLVALMVTVAMATTSADSNRQTHRANRLGDTNDPSILMNNLLLELDESLPECSSAFRRVQHGERSAHASYPPDIKGLWVSQE